jgi:hypothetical protein
VRRNRLFASAARCHEAIRVGGSSMPADHVASVTVDQRAGSVKERLCASNRVVGIRVVGIRVVGIAASE